MSINNGEISTAQTILNEIKRGHYNNKSVFTGLLKQIIIDYPDTDDSCEAKQLLYKYSR